MTDELTLIEFLRARLNEDERVARESSGEPWEAPGFTHCYPECSVETDETDRAHIERHGPTRVLAEVAAKRAILDAYDETHAWYTKNPKAPAGEVTGLYTAIRLLAQPYAGQPGWRDEWTVTG